VIVRDCPHKAACLACLNREACLARDFRDFFKSLRTKFSTFQQFVFYILRFHLQLKSREIAEIFKVNPSTAWKKAERAKEKKVQLDQKQ